MDYPKDNPASVSSGKDYKEAYQTGQDKSVENALNKITSYTNAKKKDERYITMVLQNLYSQGMVDGMKEVKKIIWEK